MMDDKELIEAAIAAGKVRSIPPGVTRGHPRWTELATPDPLQTTMGKRIYYLMKVRPDDAHTVKSLARGMHICRMAATGPTALDSFERMRGALEVLAAHGVVGELPAAKGEGRRWKLLDGSLPQPSLKAMQAESRRLRKKHRD